MICHIFFHLINFLFYHKCILSIFLGFFDLFFLQLKFFFTLFLKLLCFFILCLDKLKLFYYSQFQEVFTKIFLCSYLDTLKSLHKCCLICGRITVTYHYWNKTTNCGIFSTWCTGLGQYSLRKFRQ